MQETEKLLKRGLVGIARQLVMAIKLGREMGGAAYMQRLEEECQKNGYEAAPIFAHIAGLKENEADAIALGKIADYIDSTFDCQWEYIEQSPKVFEKRVHTCPVASTYKEVPEICDRLGMAMVREVLKRINPKSSFIVKESLPSGGKACHFRIEIEE